MNTCTITKEEWSAVSGVQWDSSLINVPNAITAFGYFSSVMWLIGFSPWWAALGLLCDELDGEAARNLGQESSFGDAYDSATDLCLATATLVRMGLPWAMLAPLVTAGSVALREGAWKPPLGSARAVATMLALPGLP